MEQPRYGDVVNGYRYIGGDYTRRNSWIDEEDDYSNYNPLIEEEDSAFVSGVKGGVDSLQGTAYGLVGLAGAATGLEGVRDWGLEGYQENMDDVGAVYKPAYSPENWGEGDQSYLQDVGDATAYWSGYGLSNIVPGLVGGGVGTILGKGAVKKFAGEATKDLLKKGAARGGVAGTLATGVGQELGATYGGAVDEALAEGKTVDDVDLGRVAIAGTAAGLLEGGADLLTMGLGRFGPTKGMLGAVDDFGGKIAQTAIRGTTAGATEAGTEVIQTGIEEMGAGKSFEEANFSDSTSAFAGLVGGGQMGAAGGLRVPALTDAQMQRLDESRAQTEAQEQALVAQQEAEAQAQEEALQQAARTRVSHSKTFMGKTDFDAAAKAEYDLMRAEVEASLADPQSEAGQAFTDWQLETGATISDGATKESQKENATRTKNFLDEYIPHTKPSDEEFAAAQDEHANYKEDVAALSDEDRITHKLKVQEHLDMYDAVAEDAEVQAAVAAQAIEQLGAPAWSNALRERELVAAQEKVDAKANKIVETPGTSTETQDADGTVKPSTKKSAAKTKKPKGPNAQERNRAWAAEQLGENWETEHPGLSQLIGENKYQKFKSEVNNTVKEAAVAAEEASFKRDSRGVVPVEQLSDGDTTLVRAFMGWDNDNKVSEKRKPMSLRALAKKTGLSKNKVQDRLKLLGYNEEMRAIEALGQYSDNVDNLRQTSGLSDAADNTTESEKIEAATTDIATAEDDTVTLSDEHDANAGGLGAGQDAKDGNLGVGTVANVGGAQTDIGTGKGWKSKYNKFNTKREKNPDTKLADELSKWSDDEISQATADLMEANFEANDTEVNQIVETLAAEATARAKKTVDVKSKTKTKPKAKSAEAAWKADPSTKGIAWEDSTGTDTDAANGLGTKQRTHIEKKFAEFESGEITEQDLTDEIEYMASTAQTGVSYSKNSKTTKTETNPDLVEKTLAKVEQAIKDIISKIAPTSTWAVTYHKTEADAVAARILTSKQADGTVQAFVTENEDGQLEAHFILGNIEPGTEFAVFLHELGGHMGLEQVLSKQDQKALYRYMMELSVSNKDTLEVRVAKAAMQRVKDADLKTLEEKQSELVAYFLEEAVLAGVNPTVLNHKTKFGRFLAKIWKNFKRVLTTLQISPSNMTAQDIVDLAYGAAELTIRTSGRADSSPMWVNDDFTQFRSKYFEQVNQLNDEDVDKAYAEHESRYDEVIKQILAKGESRLNSNSFPAYKDVVSRDSFRKSLAMLKFMTMDNSTGFTFESATIMNTVDEQFDIHFDAELGLGGTPLKGFVLKTEGTTVYNDKRQIVMSVIPEGLYDPDYFRRSTAVYTTRFDEKDGSRLASDQKHHAELPLTPDAGATLFEITIPGVRDSSDAGALLERMGHELGGTGSGQWKQFNISDTANKEIMRLKSRVLWSLMDGQKYNLYYSIRMSGSKMDTTGGKRTNMPKLFKENVIQRMSKKSKRAPVKPQDESWTDTAKSMFHKVGARVKVDGTFVAKHGRDSFRFLPDFIRTVKTRMPSAQKWYDSMLKAAMKRTELRQQVEGIAVRAKALPQEQLDQVNAFLGQSTFYQKWGYTPEWDKTIVPDPLSALAFDRMNVEQKQIVVDVFAHGKEMQDIKKALAKQLGVKGSFFTGSGLEGPYAPLKRYGNFMGELKSQALLDIQKKIKDNGRASKADEKLLEELLSDENHYVISFFDTKGQAQEFVDENVNDYAFTDASERADSVGDGRTPDYAVLQKVLGSLKVLDKTANLPKGARAAFEAMVNELYVNSLDQDNARKSEQRRKGRAGYDSNMIRGFLDHSISESNLVANMMYGAEINENFAEAGQQVKNDTGHRDLASVFSMISEHYKQLLNFKETQIQDRVAAVTTVYMLTSTMGYHLTNMTQPWMVTLPVLGGMFGVIKSAVALTKGYGVAIKDGVANFAPKTFETTIDISKAPKKYQVLLREMQLKGILDVGIEQDLIGFKAFRTGYNAVDKASETMATVTHKLYQAARYVEALNRISTAIAAYDLAKEAPTKVPDNTTATEFAVASVQDTQGDFSSLAAPIVIKKAPKLTVQYRKYQILMAWVYSKAIRGALKGETPQIRAVARRQLTYMLAGAGGMAGAAGMPFVSEIAKLLLMMGGDDEPEDLEKWIYLNVKDKTLADTLAHGVMGVLGINANSKLSQANIFYPTPYAKFEPNAAGVARFAYDALAGPSGTVAANQFGGALDYAERGQYYRATEQALPKGIRNIMESLRLGTEGFSLKNGDVMRDPETFNSFQLVLNAFGIPTSQISKLKWTQGQQYEIKQHYADAEKDIKQDYLKAYERKDYATMKELRVDWRKVQKSRRQMQPFFGNDRTAMKPKSVSLLTKSPSRQRKREKKSKKTFDLD